MRRAAGMSDHGDILAHLVDIVRRSNRLDLGIQTALQALFMGRDASRAIIGVAPQRLDAANGKHEAAPCIDHVGAGAIRPGHFRRGHQLARRNHANAVAQAPALKNVRQHGKRRLQRKADIVHKRHGRRAGAAVAAVYGDEIRRRFDSPPLDRIAEIVQPAISAKHRLKAGRQF